MQSPCGRAEGQGGAAGDLELLRRLCLAELDRWMFEPSDWEARTVAEIADLPVFRVPRVRSDESAALGMLARHCHANVRHLANGDPSGAARQVTGWWRLGGKYVLHSVLETENGLRCVTPAPLHGDDALDFVPDARIEWREADGVPVAYRDGHPIGPGIRVDPAEEMTALDRIRHRLRSGMDPYDAIRPDEE